jgi:hypothetical protein
VCVCVCVRAHSPACSPATGDDAADVAMYGQRVLDGRRGNKQPKRKCVDFNTTFLRHLHQRVLFRDYRDLPDMQPSWALTSSCGLQPRAARTPRAW